MAQKSAPVAYQFDGRFSRPARVELWYRPGKSLRWQFYGYDSDSRSPVFFQPPGEGRYQVLVVAVAPDGTRSVPLDSASGALTADLGAIAPDTPASQTLFFDWSEPQLFVDFREDIRSCDPGDVVVLAWAGFDVHLPNRPVSLFWQEEGADTPQDIRAGLTAHGTLQWPVPIRAAGKTIRVMAEIADVAGHRRRAVTEAVVVNPMQRHADSPPDDRERSDTSDITHVDVVPDRPVTAPDRTAQPTLPDPNTPVLVQTGVIEAAWAGEGAVLAGPQCVPADIAPESDSKPSGPKAAEQALRSRRSDRADQPQADRVDPNTPALPQRQVMVKVAVRDSDYYYRKAKLYNLRGEWRLAVMACQNALDLDPRNLPARLELADIYFRTGEYQLAAREYELCRLADPNNKAALFGLAQTHLALNHYEESKKIRDQFFRQYQPDWESLFLSQR